MVLQGRASSGWGSSSSLDSRFTRVRSIAYHFMHLSNNRVPEITLDYIPGLRGEKKTELSSQLFSAHGEFFILLLVLLPLRITRVFCFQYKKNIYFKSRDCVLWPHLAPSNSDRQEFLPNVSEVWRLLIRVPWTGAIVSPFSVSLFCSSQVRDTFERSLSFPGTDVTSLAYCMSVNPFLPTLHVVYRCDLLHKNIRSERWSNSLGNLRTNYL